MITKKKKLVQSPYDLFTTTFLEVVEAQQSEDKEKKTKKTERKHQTPSPFHAPAEEKETAKSVWVCCLISVLSPPHM